MTRQEFKEKQIRDALLDLSQDPRFETFMKALRDMRESAVLYMIDHTTAKDQRESLCAIGEVRCFDTIWAAYQSAKDTVQAQSEVPTEDTN